jgi:hypothetical protein
MFLRGLKMPGGAQDEELQGEGARGEGARGEGARGEGAQRRNMRGRVQGNGGGRRGGRGGGEGGGDVRVGGTIIHASKSTNSRVSEGAVVAGASPPRGVFIAPRGGATPAKAPVAKSAGKDQKSAGRLAASPNKALPTKGAERRGGGKREAELQTLFKGIDADESGVLEV